MGTLMKLDDLDQTIPAALEAAVSHPESLPPLSLTQCKVICEVSDDLRHVFDFKSIFEGDR